MAYPRVLVPTDFSKGSLAVLQTAVALAPFGVREVIVLHVMDVAGLETPVARAKRREVSDDIQDAIAKTQSGDVAIRGDICAGPGAAECILLKEREHDADLIVLGSTGKTPIEELLQGSLSEQIAREAQVPVLWIRLPLVAEQPGEELVQAARSIADVVLHPTDFSECSGRALDSVVDISPGRLIVATAIDDESLSQEQAAAAEAEAAGRLETMQRRLSRLGIETEIRVGVGDVADFMLRIADEEHATMIALGSRGKGIVTETILGSVSASILRRSEVPVLVTH